MRYLLDQSSSRSLFLTLLTIGTDLCFFDFDGPSSLDGLHLEGNVSFQGIDFAARDYGNYYFNPPLAVIYPGSVSDIARTIHFVLTKGPLSPLTVAARGHGHSAQGQVLAPGGIAIAMEKLSGQKIQVNETGLYVDVHGGELWVDVLTECLKYGLTPKSWVDYLYLTVGGTLSNGGLSGQTFRHGPQTSNVLQMEVVTGKGEVVTCSEETNSDLFYSVLAGLGQFGIITRARIPLEPALKMVKWIRAAYTDFATFARDQEHIISAEPAFFDYLEGFVSVNQTGTFYTLEVVKYFNPDCVGTINQEIQRELSQLSFIPSSLSVQEVSYYDFHDRVHKSEKKFRAQGLWDVPHPWLHLILSRSKIQAFADGVFGKILNDTNNDPVLMYPMNKSKFNNRTSFVFPEPDEEIFHMIGLLLHANPTSTGTDGLEYLDRRNKEIIEFCEANQLGAKQYLPDFTTQEEWRDHFSPRWQEFIQRKKAYDPLAMLSPGQRIFQKGHVPHY